MGRGSLVGRAAGYRTGWKEGVWDRIPVHYYWLLIARFLLAFFHGLATIKSRVGDNEKTLTRATITS